MGDLCISSPDSYPNMCESILFSAEIQPICSMQYKIANSLGGRLNIFTLRQYTSLKYPRSWASDAEVISPKVPLPHAQRTVHPLARRSQR
jgi:hypothetical protein